MYSSEQTESENETCQLRHHWTTEVANHLLQKQELERIQWIQQFNQLDTEIQHDIFPSKKLN